MLDEFSIFISSVFWTLYTDILINTLFMFQKSSRPHQRYENTDAGCQAHAKATVADITSTVRPRWPKQRKHAEQPRSSCLHINTENCASEYLHPGRGSPKISAWKAKTLRKIVINKKHWCACVEALVSTDA